jgi:hypothetical protein
MYKSPADLSIKTESVTFEKWYFGMQSRVSRYVLEELKRQHADHTLRQAIFYQQLDPVTDEMLVGIKAWMLKSQIVEQHTLEIKVPATWFDHWKQDWLQSDVYWKAWVASRFAPPKYVLETKTVDHVTRVCPHNDTYFSENKQHIQWLLWRNDGLENRMDSF